MSFSFSLLAWLSVYKICNHHHDNKIARRVWRAWRKPFLRYLTQLTKMIMRERREWWRKNYTWLPILLSSRVFVRKKRGREKEFTCINNKNWERKKEHLVSCWWCRFSFQPFSLSFSVKVNLLSRNRHQMVMVRGNGARWTSPHQDGVVEAKSLSSSSFQ